MLERSSLPEGLQQSVVWSVDAEASASRPGIGVIEMTIRNGDGLQLRLALPLGWPENFEACDMEAAGLVVAETMFDALAVECRRVADEKVGLTR